MWSGHFHKPQEVGNINYVGSGYQVTAAEAGEKKRFVWLDGDFNYVEDVPLPRFGREYHRGVGKIGEAKEGDVVVVEVEEGEEETMQEYREECDHRGISLRVKVLAPATSQPTTPANPTLSTRSTKDLLLSYIATVEKNNPNSTIPESFKFAAAEIVDDGEQGEIGRGAKRRAKAGRMTVQCHNQQHLFRLLIVDGTTPFRETFNFGNVELEGFASFQSSTNYPLASRGVVLVKGGGIQGGEIHRSNGSGKTSLLMSSFWALTGSMDPRPTVTESVNDVVNNKVDQCTVKLDFKVGGIEGTVERRKGKVRLDEERRTEGWSGATASAIF